MLVRRPGVLVAVAGVAGLAGLVVELADGDSASRQRTNAAPVGNRSAPAPGSGRSVMTIGYSVHHRPIRAVRVGDPRAPRAVLVVGCIHGNERAGIAVAKRLAAGPGVRGAALWIVPVLNPDGVAADTRQNGDEVDLNRNFPYRWRRLGSRGYLQYAGPHALSEPEARAARGLILRVRPQISIWFHQPLGVVDLSGGNPAIERRFGHLTGLPVRRLIRYPGSAAGWENWRLPGTTAFVVELPPGPMPRPNTVRYAVAVRRLAGR